MFDTPGLVDGVDAELVVTNLLNKILKILLKSIAHFLKGRIISGVRKGKLLNFKGKKNENCA